jgi:hypothetical protein
VPARRPRSPLFTPLLLGCLAIAGCATNIDPDGAEIAQMTALRAALARLERAMAESPPRTPTAPDAGEALRASTSASLLALDDAIEHVHDRSYAQGAAAVKGAFAVFRATRQIAERDLDESESLNQALAEIATTLDGLAFGAERDALWAVKPFVLRRETTREISLLGHFPSVGARGGAVDVLVGASRVSARRTMGGLVFEAPREIMAGDAVRVPVVVDLAPQSGRGGTVRLVSALRLARRQPFVFDIDAIAGRPPYATLEGRRFTQVADEGTPSRSMHLAADALFRDTVGDPRFDASTASLVGVRTVEADGVRSCDTCPLPTGSVADWNGSGLELLFSTPRCDYQVVNRPCRAGGQPDSCPAVCKGGNSVFRLTFVPTFTVRVRGEATRPGGHRQVTLAPNALARVQMPADITTAIVRLSFDDGFDRDTTTIAVSRRGPVRTPRFDATLEGGSLLIQTR